MAYSFPDSYIYKEPPSCRYGETLNIDLKTIEHSTLEWNCDCHKRTDVSTKQAFIECDHIPVKKFSHIELVKKDHKGLGALFDD